MSFMKLGKIGTMCAPAFLLAGCVTMQPGGLCEEMRIPANCYNAIELENFLMLGQTRGSFVGGNRFNNILLVEHRLREMNDEQVASHFRPLFAKQLGENGEEKLNLASRMLDAREQGSNLSLRGNDLELLEQDNVTVISISPERTQEFLDNNEGVAENSSLPSIRGLTNE